MISIRFMIKEHSHHALSDFAGDDVNVYSPLSAKSQESYFRVFPQIIKCECVSEGH